MSFFKDFENEDDKERLQGSLSLARQTSIYSLTFDELQSTIGGGTSKDFGSMNIDELLKSISSAEETQTHNQGSSSGVQHGDDAAAPGGYLQRQGSITLPRTLSQKTVCEVWRGLSKDYGGELKDGTSVPGGSKMSETQRQPTLGEITLEEFLVRAGIVREDAQPVANSSTNGIFDNFMQSGNNSSFDFEFQQNDQNLGLMGNRTPGTTDQITFQSPNLSPSVLGGRSGQQQQLPTLLQSQLQQTPQQQQQLFPKQDAIAYSTPMAVQSNGHLNGSGTRGKNLGISNGTNGHLLQTSVLQGGGQGMVAFNAGAVTVSIGSPSVSSDGIGKCNEDTSSVSPVPYLFSGGSRGRKSSGVEKVVERRQRRMIKNRESAARSRARKQAYTMELEAEISKLKEENEELLKKQKKMDLQRIQQEVAEVIDRQPDLSEEGGKKRCLRRTQTGPW